MRGCCHGTGSHRHSDVCTRRRPAVSLQVHSIPAKYFKGDSPAILGGEPTTLTLAVTNTGDAPTSDPIVLTDTLGAGLTFGGNVDPGPNFSCGGDASPATPLTCTRTMPLGAGESDSIQFSATVVEVATDEEVTATNSATVSGGGVPGAVSAGFAALVFPPYAIDYFSARTTTDASETTEYTVAGGHPFQTVNAFEFAHSKFGSNLEPTEDIKDGYVTLPPGFIGNPAAAPRCPVPNIGDRGRIR